MQHNIRHIDEQKSRDKAVKVTFFLVIGFQSIVAHLNDRQRWKPLGIVTIQVLFQLQFRLDSYLINYFNKGEINFFGHLIFQSLRQQ